jgi:YaaC-like Protein
MTSSRFLDFIQIKSKQSFSLQETKDHLLLSTDEMFLYNSASPIHYHTGQQIFMLSLNKNSKSYILPELISHYLILYNLSMIARYETEWWSELFKTTPNDDYPTIMQFLKTTQSKTAFLVFNWLMNRKNTSTL